MITQARCAWLPPKTVSETVDKAPRPRFERGKRRRLMIAQIGLSLCVGVSANILAHGGGLDSHGCHNDRSAGDYHCHQGPLEGQSFTSKQAAMEQGPQSGQPASNSSDASGRTSYDRGLYDHWIDADNDCQDTRQEVLITQGEAIRLDAQGCRVVSGIWEGPYTGQRFTDPSDLHVDHIVPLAEAHKSGAAKWSAARRRTFSNDHDNLLAVEAGENMSKGASDPAEWLPELGRCLYVDRWTRIKARYELSTDVREREVIARVRAQCQ